MLARPLKHQSQYQRTFKTPSLSRLPVSVRHSIWAGLPMHSRFFPITHGGSPRPSLTLARVSRAWLLRWNSVIRQILELDDSVSSSASLPKSHSCAAATVLATSLHRSPRCVPVPDHPVCAASIRVLVQATRVQHPLNPLWTSDILQLDTIERN